MKIIKIFLEDYRSFDLIGKIIYLFTIITWIASIVLFVLTFISESEFLLSITAYFLGAFVALSSICGAIKTKNLKCLFFLLFSFIIILYGLTH